MHAKSEDGQRVEGDFIRVMGDESQTLVSVEKSAEHYIVLVAGQTFELARPTPRP